MKNYYIFFLTALLFIGCSSEDTQGNQGDTKQKEDQVEPTLEELLANHWVYKERVNDVGTKRIEFGDENSERIIKLELNGHFMIYDSIINQEMINSGVPRIAKKSTGQWEILDNKLILNHIENDTIKKEELSIDKIENRELVTSTKNREKITYYALD